MFFDFFKKKPKVEPVQDAPIAPVEPVVPASAGESSDPVASVDVTPAQSEVAPQIEVVRDVAPIPSEPVTPAAIEPAAESVVAAEPLVSVAIAEPVAEVAPAPIAVVPPVPEEPVAKVAAVAPDVVESETAIAELAVAVAISAPVSAPASVPEAAAPVAEPQKLGLFARIKQGLARTSSHFAEGLGNLFLGRKTIDDDLFEELETQLLVADVGMDATSTIIDKLTARVARKQLHDGAALYAALREELTALLRPVEQPLVIPARTEPYVILVVGVNGVGKTTTIGKLAKRLQGEGKKVMLAAGDTFRAAAVEQLQVWGERNQIPVIAQHTGADSASVIFDALQAAKSRKIDVIIADTAGRLHNKSHLMEELAKVKRVMTKLDTTAPHEVLLVLDAGTGQNALNQADHFRDAAGVTGIALTKLDGTAKGGVIFALSQKFGLPVRFIGVGEGIDDLQPFAAEAFVSALFDKKID